MRVKASPYLLLVLTTLFWAGNFVLGRAVKASIPPIGLAFWRWAIALALLLPFACPTSARSGPCYVKTGGHWPCTASWA